MKCIIGNQFYKTPDGSSVQLTNSASDPVPTCVLVLKDANSSITIAAMSEILILDEQVIANPTVNLLQDPSVTAYNSGSWTATPQTGVVLAQLGAPGGMSATFTNAAVSTGATLLSQQVPAGATIIPGQSYVFSFYAQGSSTPTAIGAWIQIQWVDVANNAGATASTTFTVPVPTALTRYNLVAVAPANAASVILNLGYTTNNATNSGVISYTQVQVEPKWFPTISYPTPYCGPAQTNCRQLPLGLYIRQYRKFAGFVNNTIYSNYHGNIRDVEVDAVGYSWLASLYSVNDSFSNQTDAQIITTLVNKYFKSNATPMTTQTSVITGVTVSAVQSNLDDLRTLFDSLCGLSGFYWTIDPYWNFIYAPPSYFSMQITLIGDSSAQPDYKSSFPVYNFSVQKDFTQPGCTIQVIGATTTGASPTTYQAKVHDGGQIAQLNNTSGYFLPVANSVYARKVQDSTINSNSDCTQRGLAELIQYDYPRLLIHLSTNVELLAGYGVSVTSATDGLNASTQLVQQVTAKWLGTTENPVDFWEYQADLGATNKAATHILSRIFRIATKQSSLVTLSNISLATLENIGVVDQVDSGSGYAETVLSDSPLAYYRLGEPPGFSITTAYDWGGNGYNGAINGGVTLGTAGALFNDLNTAMTADGSTGYIACAAGLSTNGLAALTVEFWINPSNNTFSGTPVAVGNNTPGGTHLGFNVSIQAGGAGFKMVVGNGTVGVTQSNLTRLLAGTWYHIVGVFNGSSVSLYLNGISTGPGTGLSGTIGNTSNTVDFFHLPSQGDWLPAILDEIAIYSTALSSARIAAHYLSGTKGGLR